MFIILLVLFLALQCEGSAVLDHETLPAAGTQSAILKVDAFGRYAITVTSKQGTALQFIDRMAGPGPILGAIGEQNGRLDTFLDRGTYKILAHSHPKGKGDARVEIHSFTELNSPQPPMLVELKQIQHELEDFQQISYWIHIPERRAVVLEAAGRNLADLRLWQDGNWLVDAAPEIKIVQPKQGKPLLICRLTAELNPGLYLLSAYGGLSQPWAESAPDHPFYLRFGIPRLPEAGRSRFVLSAFGADYWLVPGAATFFRMELPEARSASLAVGWYDAGNASQAGTATASISKDSVPPAAELIVAGDPKKLHFVKIEAEADQVYILQQFELRDDYSFQRDGEHWVSTIHSGHPADSVDAAGILVQYDRYERPAPAPVASQLILLDKDHGWMRRFNLLDMLTLFFHIKQPGKYQILAKGAQAQFRFEPFWLNRPEKYKAPSLGGSGSVWDLDAGYYVLTAIPEKAGILDLTVKPAGMLDYMLNMLGLDSDSRQENVRAAVRFPEINLNLDFRYTLFVNQQPGVRAGVILRALPMDLAEPLFVSLQPDETVSAPVQVLEAGTIRAQCEDGSLLQVSVDGGSWKRSIDVPPGMHTVSVRNIRGETLGASLLFEAFRLQASTPLPSLPDATLAALPKFPVVSEKTPQHFDLQRNARTTFVVNANHPDLYVLQTKGLLDTAGNLRTRTVTSFVSEDGKGSGRNFLIQQYLREGDYQITVEARGTSQGHLSLELSRNKVLDGGFLNLDNPARISLSEGQAALYNFVILSAGEYSLQSFGIGKTFPGRLEDADGWPIEPPNRPVDLRRHFEPGKYRLMLMPDSVPTRRITLLKKIEAPVQLAGHGPHSLKLGLRIQHQWLESENPRRADVWQLSIPAATEVNIALTNEMHADLVRLDQKARKKVAYVPPQRGWKGPLEKGDYQLEVTCVRRNNRVTYELEAQPEQLVAGTKKQITAPVSVPVSVGDSGLVEFASFGTGDVRARLSDVNGIEIARNDDRPDDWNFHFGQSLQPGVYQLEVEAVGENNAETTVSMRAPQEIENPDLNLPANVSVELQDAVHIYPLLIAENADLLLVSGKSSESIGIAVDVFDSDRWKTTGSIEDHVANLEVPVLPGRKYRMRTWSVDHRGVASTVTAVAIQTSIATEAELKKGIVLKKVPGLDSAVGAIAINTDRPGLFAPVKVELRSSAEPELSCAPSSDGFIKSSGQKLWIVAGSNTRVQATRVFLAANMYKETAVSVSGSPAIVDLSVPELGPVLAVAKSVGGEPSLQVLRQNSASFDPREMAVAGQATLAVSLTSDLASARIWSGTSSSMQTRLTHFSFPVAAREQISWGDWVGVLKGVTSREYALPLGLKSVQVTLDQNIAAVFASGNTITSVHWGGEEPYAEIVETTGERLLLFHLRSADDGFRIEVLPLQQATPPLTASAPYEKAHPTSGVFRLEIAPSHSADTSTLHLRGAAGEAIWVSNEGVISKGKDIRIAGTTSPGGAVVIRHKPGLVFGWIDSKEVNGLWGSQQVTAVGQVHSPTTFPLHGKAQSFQIRTGVPVMLHARTTVPVISRLTWDTGEEVEVHEKGAVVNAFLPKGDAQLDVRALGENELWGNAQITISRLTNIVEGIGPESVLPSGGAVSYSFEVKRKGKIGLGVRVDKEIVNATLLDSAGKRLGIGVSQMHELLPGMYIFSIHVPENSGPVHVQPVVVGLTAPPIDPPEDVIRAYLQMTVPNPTGAAIPFASPPPKVYEPSEGSEYHHPEDYDGEYESYDVE